MADPRQSTSSQNAPAPIALTCGEPAGVGPELAMRAAERLEGRVPFFWIGDPRHLPSGARITEIAAPKDAVHVPTGTLPVLRHDFPALATAGTPNHANAQGVIDVITRAVGLVRQGLAGGVTTAPINKRVLKDGADFAYPGHTEFLAHLGGVERVVMMLACPALRVVPTTIHIALKDVPDAFTPDLLDDTIRITARDLKRYWGLSNPRIAVAGLNPHAGEGGAMGHEEDDWMRTLIEGLRREGYAIKGPMPPDTMFHEQARAGYDVAICAYHDQALIPIKTLDFAGGVNVTLGLPFIRTSPDHGTAFDIAGQGKADPTSLVAALDMAWDMARATPPAQGAS
ncbi:4-hydroxythreonine-4-phosphate dehydrogenase PdxA [Celeribacter sp.]|uniref:4-hydroxythreonine-4-phosphate dehydrogenase PdxA n=1 Tax=Celeribacter sp. TaxID=1890673 RepID=UPI003A927D56